MNKTKLFLRNLPITFLAGAAMFSIISSGLPDANIFFVIALTLLYWFNTAVKETDKDILEKRIKDLEEKIGK